MVCVVVVGGWFCCVSGVAVAGRMSMVVRRSSGMVFSMFFLGIFFSFPLFLLCYIIFLFICFLLIKYIVK